MAACGSSCISTGFLLGVVVIPEPSVTKDTFFITLLFVVFSDFDISKLFLDSCEVNSELSASQLGISPNQVPFLHVRMEVWPSLQEYSASR